MIIDRYVRREILRPILPIVGILSAVFASYSTATFLSDAVSGLMAPDAIAEMVGLKVLIALEVLVPVGLYVSVVFALGRFSGDGELVAAYALRVPPRQVTRAVILVSLALALAVGAFSLFGRPWAYRELHRLSAEATGTLDAGAMRPGTFYVGRNGDRMIFFSRQDAPGAPAKDVVVQIWRGPSRMEIIHAARADLLTGPAGQAGSRVDLHDAHIYKLDLAHAGDDQVLQADDMIVDPDDDTAIGSEYSSVAASTRHLIRGRSTFDVAELQWRLSTPVSTLLLGLLGIPMSRASSGRNRYARLAAAILVYFAYYIVFTSARTWVQHGAIGTWPGIWWVPGLLALGLVGAFWGPVRNDFATGRA